MISRDGNLTYLGVRNAVHKRRDPPSAFRLQRNLSIDSCYWPVVPDLRVLHYTNFLFSDVVHN